MRRWIAQLAADPTPGGAPDLASYGDRQVSPPSPETDKSGGLSTLQPVRWPSANEASGATIGYTTAVSEPVSCDAAARRRFSGPVKVS
jgi:hypothetical protein